MSTTYDEDQYDAYDDDFEELSPRPQERVEGKEKKSEALPELSKGRSNAGLNKNGSFHSQSSSSHHSSPHGRHEAKQADSDDEVTKLKQQNKYLMEQLKQFSRMLDNTVDKKSVAKGKGTIMGNRAASRQHRLGLSAARDQELQNAIKRIDIYKKANEALKKQLNKSLVPDRVLELENKVSAKKKELGQMKEELKTLKSENRRLQKDLAAMNQSQGDYPAQVAALIKELQGYKEKLKATNQKYHQDEKQRRKKQNYVSKLEARCRELESAQGRKTATPKPLFSQDTDKLRQENEKLKTTLAEDKVRYQRAINKLRKQLDGSYEENKRVSEELVSAQRQVQFQRQQSVRSKPSVDRKKSVATPSGPKRKPSITRVKSTKRQGSKRRGSSKSQSKKKEPESKEPSGGESRKGPETKDESANTPSSSSSSPAADEKKTPEEVAKGKDSSVVPSKKEAAPAPVEEADHDYEEDFDDFVDIDSPRSPRDEDKDKSNDAPAPSATHSEVPTESEKKDTPTSEPPKIPSKPGTLSLTRK